MPRHTQPLPCCLLAFKLTHGWGNSARSALAGKGAEARFALLCQCSLPTSILRVLRSSLYCRLSSDLHSFRFCTSCAHVSWASRTSQGDRSSVVRHYHAFDSPVPRARTADVRCRCTPPAIAPAPAEPSGRACGPSTASSLPRAPSWAL
jgi:hypothetical protein